MKDNSNIELWSSFPIDWFIGDLQLLFKKLDLRFESIKNYSIKIFTVVHR